MRKNQSSKYWAGRAAALELEIQQVAAAEAERVKQIYKRAIENINSDIDIVFRNFTKHLGIDEARARELIEAAENDREIAELQKLLEDAADAAEQDEIVQRINAQAYGARMSRLEAVKSNIYIEMRKAAQAEKLIHTALSAKAIQKAYYTTIHNTAQGLNCGISFSLIPTRAVEQLQKAQWLGSNYSSRIWKNNGQFISQLQKTIEDGVTAGHSIDRMARQMKDFVNEESGKSPIYVTERLVRTETAHFMAEGQAAAYEEIGMETYRFLAALSERTCEACAALDGNIYRMAERVPGMNYPPIHPNCRCVTISGDFIPKTRIARDPLDGRNYKVDGSMTYEQWKASLTPEQKQAMELHVKQMKNKSADMKQYEKYKQVLGAENVPKTFDKWQDLKYNDSEVYSFIKLDYSRQSQLNSRPELALPNAKTATADDRKFTDYLFGGSNAQGLAKGKAFTSRLGYDIGNYSELKREILTKAEKYPTKFKGDNGHGKLYEQKIILYGFKGKPANVVVGWINNDKGTKMTSTYIKEVK